MAINLEKLYANACENLRTLCYGLVREDKLIAGTAEELYDKATKDPGLVSRWYPCLAPAIEIREMTREEINKSKGGSTYTILKKFIKNIKGYRTDINGAWLDDEGRQCLCDGYRGYRLNAPIEGLKEPDNPGNRFDLGKVFPTDPQPTTLKLPTSAELRAFISDPTSLRASDGTVLYDFGENLPMVNAKYLKDMVDVFPDAVATCDGLVKPLIFKSKKGDGILLPVRKRVA